MEIEDNGSMRESKFKYLVQQVEEQSVYCDITVKVGLWEKKFHRCVLVSSPFFEHAMKGNFVEKWTGIVSVGVGTSITVEAAIMYLYGIEPKISTDNVEALLQLAEFFMIRGLKRFCIRWLSHTLEITQRNFMFVLQISTFYKFEVKQCTEYIESHLSQVFLSNEAENLSKDSIEYLLKDKRFSYVTMDEKLKFLIKWASKHTTETTENIKGLFEAIDLQEITYPTWEETEGNKLFNEITESQNLVFSRGNNKRQKCLIMTCESDYFWCLDLQDDIWYRLNLDTFHTSFKSPCRNIAGVRNSSEIIFTKFERNTFPELVSLNLDTDRGTTFKLELKDEDITQTELTNVCFSEDTVVAVINKRLQIIETSYPERMIIPVICSNDKLFPSQLSNEGKEATVKDVNVAEVFVGKASDENVEMSQIVCLRNVEITQACLNKHSNVAFLLKNKQFVILFDLKDHRMERIELEPESDYKISQTDNGFLVYNNKRFYVLKRDTESKHLTKYSIRCIEQNKDEDLLRYDFCNGVWMRLLHRKLDHSFNMQYVTHEDILERTVLHDVKWNIVSIPEQYQILQKLLMGTGLAVVEIPKNKLRCHIDCPHCEYHKRGVKIALPYL